MQGDGETQDRCSAALLFEHVYQGKVRTVAHMVLRRL